MGEQEIRTLSNIEQAAKDAGISFEKALRFMEALCLLSEADRACRLLPKPPERQQ